jgi:hypothetical protein
MQQNNADSHYSLAFDRERALVGLDDDA